MNQHTFRWDAERSVLWAGERSYPARFESHSTPDVPAEVYLRMEMRRAVVRFENRWDLSVLWGDCTWSSNSWSYSRSSKGDPFIEEPMVVEVGVMLPEPITVPGMAAETADYFASRYPTSPEVIEQMKADRETYLWGEPLGYVTVEQFHRVADLVMHLPTDIDLPEGEWNSAEGFCDFLITAGLDRTL